MQISEGLQARLVEPALLTLDDHHEFPVAGREDGISLSRLFYLRGIGVEKPIDAEVEVDARGRGQKQAAGQARQKQKQSPGEPTGSRISVR